VTEDITCIDGIWWPKHDRECRPAVLRTARDFEPALALCRKRDYCVQAGGNVGIWPIMLAKSFGQVYTFEPEPINFACLVRNCAFDENIHMFKGGLSNERSAASVNFTPRNAGAHTMAIGEGDVTLGALDDLRLEGCDFLCLDIEGCEPLALQGAAKLIYKHRPVIQIEDKGLSKAYGYPQGWCEKWLADMFGYRVAQRIHRDVILVAE